MSKRNRNQVSQTDSAEDQRRAVDAQVDSSEKTSIENPVDQFERTGEDAIAQKLQEMHEQLEVTKKELAEQQDKNLRLLADLENHKRRTFKDIQQRTFAVKENLFLNLLPVVDDFERLLSQIEGTEASDPIEEGITLIYKKLISMCEAMGLKPIEALEQPFDVDLHEAMAQMEDPDKPQGVILNEIERGYKLNDHIIRHSKVVVNDIKNDESTEPDTDDNEIKEQQ